MHDGRDLVRGHATVPHASTLRYVNLSHIHQRPMQFFFFDKTMSGEGEKEEGTRTITLPAYL